MPAFAFPDTTFLQSVVRPPIAFEFELESMRIPSPALLNALAKDFTSHKFDVKQLDEMKKSCSKHCLSTCNYILGYCYETMRVLGWIAKQARRGFKGVTGSF